MKPEFFSIATATDVVVPLARHPIATVLRMARAKVDISQREAARQSRVSSHRLHLAERGLIQLRSDELERLARVLELPGLQTTTSRGDR